MKKIKIKKQFGKKDLEELSKKLFPEYKFSWFKRDKKIKLVNTIPKVIKV